MPEPDEGPVTGEGERLLIMDPDLGDIPAGDILIDGSRIAAVGPALDAPGAAVLDARGMIVAPGLVDTHWHLWNTLLRGLSGSGPGYFRACARLGPAFGPDDIHAGTLLACAEAINSGVTTVHDWCHNVRGPAHWCTMLVSVVVRLLMHPRCRQAIALLA